MTDTSIYQRYTPVLSPHDTQTTGFLFIFRANQLLVTEGPDRSGIPLSQAVEGCFEPSFRQYFGELAGRPCFCLDVDEAAAQPPDLSFRCLRSLLGQLEEDLFLVAGRAFQLVNWNRTTQFCGRCGAQTQSQPEEFVKKCPVCKTSFYPRISPAIIVAVRRGNKLLLAHNKSFRSNLYSVIAGFLEPGETFEDCVKREVMEEVGLEVTNVRYFGSQSWPFPDSLMVGFTADYAGGEIAVDGSEIEMAGWFGLDDLPVIPDKTTIAGWLIQSFVDMVKGKSL